MFKLLSTTVLKNNTIKRKVIYNNIKAPIVSSSLTTPGLRFFSSAEEDEDPFARRAKAGLDRVGHHRTISVDELEKMGGGGKSRVKDIASSADFNKALATAGKKLVVVDFFATWCGPCKQIAPQFAELSGAHRKVSFLKVDVDKNRDLSSKYEVSSMPTFLFIQNGKVLHKMAGANIDAIKSKIETYS